MSPPAPVAPTVIKLGGALLTRSQHRPTIRRKVLSRLATEIGRTREPLIVVHGAGSFGMPGAQRFGLSKPPTGSGSSAQRGRGAAIVGSEVGRLQVEVVGALLDAGARPWSIPTPSFCRQRAGGVETLDIAPFQEAITRELVAVCASNVVPDSEWGFSIVAADTLAAELAQRLSARRMILVSDVGGIGELDPEGRRRSLARVPLLASHAHSLSNAPARSGGPAAGKFCALTGLAATRCLGGLINGLSDDSVSRAARGETVTGSWSTRDES